MATYIIKTFGKYAAPGDERAADLNPYLGAFEYGWAATQREARRFGSRREANRHLDGFGGHNDRFGIRIVGLVPKKKAS